MEASQFPEASIGMDHCMAQLLLIMLMMKTMTKTMIRMMMNPPNMTEQLQQQG